MKIPIPTMSRTRKRPPRAALKALLPVQVLEFACEGGDWYERIRREIGNGWRPRHPETDEILNAEQLLAWAIGTFTSDDASRIRAARVAAELERIAFADAGKFMEWGPDGVTLVASDGMDEAQRRAVAEVSETRPGVAGGGTVRIKLHDKVAALRLLGQSCNLFASRVEVTGRDGGAVEYHHSWDPESAVAEALGSLADDEAR